MSSGNPPIHVHFGAGALAIGLVLELVRTDLRLIVVQRPSSKWKAVTGDQVVLRNSTGWFRRFSVLRSSNSQEAAESGRKAMNSSEPTLLLIGMEHCHALQLLLESACSISTSLKTGQSAYESLFATCASGNTVPAFLFENEYLLDDKRIKQFVLCEVIADRICEEPEFSENAVSVNCEHYRRLVFRGSLETWARIFVAGPKYVKNVEDPGDFEFYERQKKYLVNGIHMFLCLYAYHKLFELNIKRTEWGDQSLAVLYAAITARDSKYFHYIEDLKRAEILRLLFECRDSSPKVRRAVDGEEGWEGLYDEQLAFVESVVHRFTERPDRLTRVYPIGGEESEETRQARNKKYKSHVMGLTKYNSRHGGEGDRLPIRRRVLQHDVVEAIGNLHEILDDVK